MKEETRVKDTVLISRKTSLITSSVSEREIPGNKIFDVKPYAAREWVLIYMDKPTFDELDKLCKSRNLDTRKVLYNAIMQIRDTLSGGQSS